MPSGGGPAHVGAGLGDDDVRDFGADPWDGDHQVPGALKGLDHHLDPGRELLDGVGVLVDQVQMQLGQEGVVGVEPAGQGLSELRDLGPQPALRQVGELGGVTLPGDQRFQHGPARDAADVGGDAGQFDAGVLQELLHPLDLPATLTHDAGSGSGQVP